MRAISSARAAWPRRRRPRATPSPRSRHGWVRVIRTSAACFSTLATILARKGRHDEADRLFRDAIDLKPERNERLSILNAAERRIYGRYLIQRRRFADAEAQLLKSLQLLTSVYASENHPNPVETKRALMALYEASGQAALVERYRVPPGTYVPY